MPFALASSVYSYILAALVIAILPVMVFLLVFKKLFLRLKRGLTSAPNEADARGPGGGEEEYLPRYEEAAGPPIGLSTLSDGGDGAVRKESRERRGDLGSQQMPREYL